MNELSIGLAIVRAMGAASTKVPMACVALIAGAPFDWPVPSLFASEPAGSAARETAGSVEGGGLPGDEEAGSGASLKLKYSTMTNVAMPATNSAVETVLHVRSDPSLPGCAGSCRAGEAVWLSSFEASAAASFPTLRPTLPMFFHHMLDVGVRADGRFYDGRRRRRRR